MVWHWGSATWRFRFRSWRKGIFTFVKCFHVSNAQVTIVPRELPQHRWGEFLAPTVDLLHWVLSSGWMPCPALSILSTGQIQNDQRGSPHSFFSRSFFLHWPSKCAPALLSKVGWWSCPVMGDGQNPSNGPHGAEQCPIEHSLGPSNFFFF